MEVFKEINRNTLLEGIHKLPKYQVPLQIWTDIETGLDQHAKLQAAIDTLPLYPAPPGAWSKLERSLDQQQAKTTIYRKLFPSRRWMTAAAVGIFVFCAWWLISSDPPATTSLVYTEEVQVAPAVDSDWSAEDQTITLVLQRIDNSAIADPVVVNRLKQEYDELIEARNEVEGMLQRYGKDDDLLKEVARIERERSKVIKQLATWI